MMTTAIPSHFSGRAEDLVWLKGSTTRITMTVCAQLTDTGNRVCVPVYGARRLRAV